MRGLSKGRGTRSSEDDKWMLCSVLAFYAFILIMVILAVLKHYRGIGA